MRVNPPTTRRADFVRPSDAAALRAPRVRPRQPHGWAMPLDPIKPNFKPPGTQRLKLKGDLLLSYFAFKFNLRCYIMLAHAFATAAVFMFVPVVGTGETVYSQCTGTH